MAVLQVFADRDFFRVVPLTNFKFSLRFIKHSFCVGIGGGCTFAADLISIVQPKHYDYGEYFDVLGDRSRQPTRD